MDWQHYFENKCYHHPAEIMEIDGVTYYASDEDGVVSFKGDAVVNFTRTPNVSKSVLYPSWLLTLR